jgi:hypothetical protein
LSRAKASSVFFASSASRSILLVDVLFGSANALLDDSKIIAFIAPKGTHPGAPYCLLVVE